MSAKSKSTQPKESFRRQMFKHSALAMCVMSAFSAKAQDVDFDEEAIEADEEVVVTGIRSSLESAQEMKRSAATVQDVITASDINALPDKSVAEALQRLPGVSIDRFAGANDPDHFSIEGSGVVIRGLTRTRSEFNGRDVFSAGGSGGLNFSDVPAELLQSVVVSKNQTASMTEGGISGTVNLVTKKPFDFDGLKLAGTVKGIYGDFGGEFSPSVSGLFSNRWDMGDAGEIGFLFNASASELTMRSDSVGVYNFYERSPDVLKNPSDESLGTTALLNPALSNMTVHMPKSANARSQIAEKTRTGIATSLQWASPNDFAKVTLEFINSSTNQKWHEYIPESGGEPFKIEERYAGDLHPSQEVLLDSEGFLKYGLLSSVNDSGDFVPIEIGSTTRFRDEERIINDFSGRLELNLTDLVSLDLDLQHISATTDIVDNSGSTRFNSYILFDDTGDTPNVQYIPESMLDETYEGAELGNPSINADEKYLYHIMDFEEQSEASQTSFQADLNVAFDDSWVKGVSSGLRFHTRTQDIKRSKYNWGAVQAPWAETISIEDMANNGHANLFDSYTFDNFLRGNASLGNEQQFLFPSVSSLESLPVTDYLLANEYNLDGTPYNSATRQNLRVRSEFGYDFDNMTEQQLIDVSVNGTPFIPSEISETTDTRLAFYGQLDFGFDPSTDFEVKGNVGARVVNYSWESTGQLSYPDYENDDTLKSVDDEPPGSSLVYGERDYIEDNLDRFQDDLDFANGYSSSSRTIEGTSKWDILPSLNVTLGLLDEYVVRFGLSKALYFPNVDETRAQFGMGQNWTTVWQDPVEQTTVQEMILEPYTGGGGNPFLKPEEAWQSDLTFEWYFSDVGSLTLTSFGKKLENLFRNGSYARVETNPETGITRNILANGKINAGDTYLYGYEAAYQQAYDFLPGFWSGFGSQINYTWIDTVGSADPTPSTDFGDPNAAAKAAYGAFTDLPLEGLSEHTFNLVGFYDVEDFDIRLAYNFRSDYLITTRDAVGFKPIWGDSRGTLDFSANLKSFDMFKVGFSITNLTDSKTVTHMQYNQAGDLTPRNVNINDRTYELSVTAQF